MGSTKQTFARCPTCGWKHQAAGIIGARSEKNIQTSYDSGWVWENIVTSTGPGTLTNETANIDDSSKGERVLAALAARCRQFLEWYDGHE